jgi:Flp pilus assembly pilin Flp
VQLITDSITTWFTDIVTEVKGIFTKVKDFFVITVPTKVQEIKDSITTWFTNIKDEVVGLFTKAKDFVVVTVPEKMAEISKGISDKFTEIKDQIIDFAMAPFRKIGELFDNLLIGILESVENIPFIGGKAKEMKEAIIAKRETAAAEGEVNQIETGNLIDYGFDNNNNLTMNGDPVVMGTNSDAKQVAVAAINDGTLKEDEAQIVPTEDGFMVKRIVPATIEQGDTTTGGATGGNLNNESAEFVGAGNPTGGGNNSVVLGGNNTNNVSTISNTNVTEDTGPDDKFLKDSIYP